MTSAPRSVEPMPAGARLLVVSTCAVSLIVAVGAVGVAGTPPAPLRFLAAIGLFAVAQGPRLRLNRGTQRLSLCWGEVALLISVCMLPAAWLVAVVPIGAVVGNLLADVPAPKALYNAAVDTLSALAAVLIIESLGGLGASGQLTVHGAGALAAGAVTYWLVSAPFAVAVIRLAGTGSRVADLLLDNIGAKLVILAGNIALALLAIGLGLADFRYLAFLPPLLWLLHEVYQARIRAGDERRAWQELAHAVHTLSRLDVGEVMQAAATGAERLFAPDAVEITSHASGVRFRRHLGHEETPDTGDAADVPDAHRIRRELTVHGERVGELCLCFRHGSTLGERDMLALSAFADALGAALRNAVSHATLREMADRKAYEADHDTLTGLANRARLLERGEQWLRDAPDTGRRVALLLLDMNHFRDVNDTLGHAAGDRLLRVAAGRLNDESGDGELLARLGGDEFALLVGDPPEHRPALEYAAERAHQLAAVLSAAVEIAGVALSVEVSIGVVAVPAGGCVMAELLRRAEVAMYQAKRTGRQVARYDAERDAASTDRLALLAEFRDALAADDQLVLQLQPAIDLTTGGPTGVEALVRWRHPRRGLIGPGEFVPVVEQSELVGPFTRYVLDAALRIAADWDAEGLDVPIAVNMSARSLLDRRLPTDVAELLGRYQVAPHRLVLEITETAMMTELEIVDDVLAGLRGLGLWLSVDDFGTGYSSLTFLARFAVDEVKVDQEFVRRMGDTPEAAAIVRSTVELGRALGLRVIAEGVETAEQRNALTALGCEAGQGYHFFAPMDPAKTARVLWTLRRAAAARGARVIPLSGRTAASD